MRWHLSVSYTHLAGSIECEDKEAEVAACKAKIVEAENKLFKPIIGCEMYVARRTMDLKEGKQDQSGYHLIVLAKNETCLLYTSSCNALADISSH